MDLTVIHHQSLSFIGKEIKLKEIAVPVTNNWLISGQGLNPSSMPLYHGAPPLLCFLYCWVIFLWT